MSSIFLILSIFFEKKRVVLPIKDYVYGKSTFPSDTTEMKKTLPIPTPLGESRVREHFRAKGRL
jgi:hypothetical protein